MVQTPKRAAGFGGTLAAVLALALAPPAVAATADENTSWRGDRVEAGSNQDNAPVLEPGQLYIDTFHAETMFYRVGRTMEDSTLHVGLTTHGTDGETTDDVDVELSTLEGDSCDSDRLGWEASSAGNLLRGTQVRATAPLDPESGQAVPGCGSDSELLLAVNTLGEDLREQDFEILVAEEPEPVGAEELRDAFEDDSDLWGEDGVPWYELQRDREADNPIEPGTTWHDAPQVEPGLTYDAQLAPGEVHIFRVDADWDQQIQAEVFFPEPTSELSESLSGWTDAQISIVSPYRGAVTPGGQREAAEQNLSSRVDHANATTLRAQSYPITWAGRYAQSAGDNARHAIVPGGYYLAVAMEPSEEEADFQVPYRLTTAVYDASDDPPPEYDASPISPADTDGSGTGLSTGQATAIGIGVLGLLLLIGGGIFLAKVMQKRPADE